MTTSESGSRSGRSRLARLLSLSTVGATLAAAGCQGNPSEEREAISQPVLNGWAAHDFPSNRPPAVALYHGGPRPCSSSMITWNGWVLTAAHCVVQDSLNLNSPLKPLSAFRAAPPSSTSPGLQPPANAVAPQFLRKHPTLDIALLYFPGLASSEHTSWNLRTTSLYVGSPSELSGKVLDIWGYGRSVIGESTGKIEDGTTGAGTLRWGRVRYDSHSATHLVHVAANEGATQETWRGDSGGPTLLRNAFRWEGIVGKHVSAQTQVSVHEWSNQLNGDGKAGDVLVSAALPWINGQLGYHFFIKRLDLWDSRNGYLDVQNGGTANGTPVFLAAHTDAPAQRWQYTPSGELRNTLGNCLDVQNGNPAPGTPVWTWQCNGTGAQRWTFHANNQIRNSNGLCLASTTTSSTSGLSMQSCADVTNQRWTFSASP